MIVLRQLLVGSFLTIFSLGFLGIAKKISCVHHFQVKAFSMLSGELHSKAKFAGVGMACGKPVVIRKGRGSIKVRDMFGKWVLNLKIEGDVINHASF